MVVDSSGTGPESGHERLEELSAVVGRSDTTYRIVAVALAWYGVDRGEHERGVVRGLSTPPLIGLPIAEHIGIPWGARV